MTAKPFRILHTADWHLGRTLLQVSLLDDQRQLIEQCFLPLVREARPDLVVIAGDIYDRAVPSPDAVRLLDDTLTELNLGIGVPVVAISGNHDSEGRIRYASRILSRAGLSVSGGLAGELAPVLFAEQQVAVFPVPYFEAVEAAARLGLPGPLTAAEAMRLLLERLAAQAPAGWRRVLVGHAFVQGGSVTDSERPLPGAGVEVGGAGLVPAALFDVWDLALLGHLHRPQRIGDAVHYSGSLMKYSFSEADHVKGVTLHTLGGCAPAAERIALAPRRDLRIVRVAPGERLEEVAARDERRDDYVRIEYHGQPIPMERLREHYPNVLEPWRIVDEAPAGGGRAVATLREVREKGLEELFGDFLEYVSGGSLVLSDARREALREAVASLDAARREAR